MIVVKTYWPPCCNRTIASAGYGATPALIKALQADTAIEVRQEAARALGKIGSDSAQQALRYFAQHSIFPQIRRTCTDVLEDLATAQARPNGKKAS